MRKKYLSAAMVAAGFLALPIGVVHADEVTDLKAEAQALQKQNDALAKRLAAIEKRQKALETDTTATQRIMNARAADMPMSYKSAPAAAPVDDALCWNRVCLYGIVDAGYGYQTHGQPFNGAFPTGAQYFVSPGSNRALWTASPNALSQSTIGLKGAVAILPDLDAIFKIETGFNPMAGQLANGEGSMVQNNGLPLYLRTANGDSSRNGQALNGQVYVGVQSPLWGTLTVGRNNGLPLDQILAYDPMGGSYAFSPIGFSGTYAGGGSTEDGRLDQSIKYNWNYGLLHGGVLYQVGNYGNSSTTEFVHDDVQGNLGLIYQGFSVDGTAAKIRGVVAASPLAPSAANIGLQGLSGTISDNVQWMVTAKYKWDQFEVMGGYEHIDFANPSNPAPVDFVNNYGYQFDVVSNAAFPNDKILQMMWVGGKWKATDHLTLIGAYYHQIQNAYGIGAVAGCNTAVSSMCSGTLDAVSFLADYVFNKHFDVYAGVEYSQVANGLANGYLQTSILNAAGAAIANNGHSTASNLDPTIGARYSF